MTSDGVRALQHERVIANMVIGSNGATSLHQDSAPLSPPADRVRFHAIRRLASCLVVGGNTYRCEHYSKAPLPVFVATRNPEIFAEQYPSSQGQSFFIKAAPESVVNEAIAAKGGVVLVEGGISFISPLLRTKLIDRLFLTRSPIEGDGDFFNFEELRHNYSLARSEDVLDVTFEEWVPIRD